MTLQAIKGGLWFPGRFFSDTAPGFSGTLLLDAASESAGFIVKANKTGNLDRVVITLGAVSITSGPLNFDVRVESVDAATGLPSGTLLGTNSNATLAIADTDDNISIEITLTTAVAVTRGTTDFAVMLVAPGSGTFSVILQSFGGDFACNFPYAVLNGVEQQRAPALGLRYDDGIYTTPPGCYPIATFSSTSISSASTPDDIGNKFQVPFKGKVDAVAVWMDPGTTSDFTIRIYNSDASSTLMEMTVDSDVHPSTTDGWVEFPLDDEISIDAATVYRICFLPGGATHEWHAFNVGTAAYMDMFDGGQNIHACTRKDAAAFDDSVTTRRYLISLRFSQLDDGAGGAGGGLLTNPGMGGGMRS